MEQKSPVVLEFQGMDPVKLQEKVSDKMAQQEAKIDKNDAILSV